MMKWITATCLAAAAALTAETALARGDIAGILIEISVRASLEASSRVTSEATLRGSTEESDRCRRAPREHRCLTFGSELDEALAAELLRESYALAGPTLAVVAELLAVDELALARAIALGMPAAPDRAALRAILPRAAAFMPPA